MDVLFATATVAARSKKTLKLTQGVSELNRLISTVEHSSNVNG